MTVERDVLDRIEALGVRYYVTGAWALSVHAEPRTTRDLDLVLDLDQADYERRVRPAFEDAYLVNDVIQVGPRAIGGLIHQTEIIRVDLMMGRRDAWARQAFERARTVEHPGLGRAPVISAEDLILAKLEWSAGGRSELQMRDCRSIVRVAPELDWTYLERYAATLGVGQLRRPSVPVDFAQRQIDDLVRAAPPSVRMRLHVDMMRLAFAQVWAAADRAGPMSELERAGFLLRRLYPDLEGPRLEAIMARLEAMWAAGTWTGFWRPSSPPDTSEQP